MTPVQSTAYRLGTLLAHLEQVGALPEPHRAYELASLRPGAMRPWIVQALRSRRWEMIREIAADLPLEDLAGGRILTDLEQSDFALGYYHQRARATSPVTAH